MHITACCALILSCAFGQLCRALKCLGGLQGVGPFSGVGAMAAGGIGAFAGNMRFGNMGGGMNMFGGGCQQVDAIRFPKVKPSWTCGVEVDGKWTCAGWCLCATLLWPGNANRFAWHAATHV